MAVCGLCDRKCLTLSILSNSEWVASRSPSNIRAERSKVGVGQEKPNKNARISTVNIAVLSSLSDTISLFSSPIYAESSTHPSSESSTLCSLSSSMKSLCPTLQKTNISLTFLFTEVACKIPWYFTGAGGRLHLNTPTSLTQWSQSGLTVLSRHSIINMSEKRAHTQLVRECSAPVISACWATVDWPWLKEWSWWMQGDFHLKEKSEGRDWYI